MKPVFLSASLLGTLVAASASLDLRWLKDSRHWIRAVVSNEAASFNTAEVKGSIATQIFSARHAAHQPGLETDKELQTWLESRIAAGNMGDLNILTDAVQVQFPRYIKLAVCTLQSPSIDDLLQRVSEWSNQTEESFTHQAISTRAMPARLGFECVIVSGQRLPDFLPEELTRGRDRFYIVCPLCRRGQACEIPPRLRSVSLECPSCHRPYAMLAVDTRGCYHHVNEYLAGHAPPAHFPAGISRLNEMLLIWNSVVHSIRYVPDSADGNEDNDAWQLPMETLQLGTGDCEDSSILLADWLISRGFEARVAVGHYAERGGHAWVIVRLDGKTYLLESTTPEVNTGRPPLAEEVGARYVPDATIDREGFYTRRSPSTPWDEDYWSQAKWQRVTSNATKTLAKTDATGTALRH